MLICNDQRWVYIAIPRTATTSIRTVLRKRFPVWQPRKNMHDTIVPRSAARFDVWYVVRNPYSRAVSMWQFETMRGAAAVGYNWRGRLPPGGMDERYTPKQWTAEAFGVWLRDVLDGQASQNEQLQNMGAFLGPLLQRPAIVIRYESLAADLQDKLDFWPAGLQLPVLNGTGHLRNDNWRQFITPQTSELVRRWAGQDFERFGYSDVGCANQ